MSRQNWRHMLRLSAFFTTTGKVTLYLIGSPRIYNCLYAQPSCALTCADWQVEVVSLQGQEQAVALMEALLPATTPTARHPRWVLGAQQPPQTLASSVERPATGRVTAQVSAPPVLCCTALLPQAACNMHATVHSIPCCRPCRPLAAM